MPGQLALMQSYEHEHPLCRQEETVPQKAEGSGLF